LQIQHRPLLVWAAAFAIGIGTSAAGWLPIIAALGLAVVGLAALALGRRPLFFAAGLLLLGLCAGALRLASFQAVAASDVSRWADKPAPVTITGTVISDPEARRGGRWTFLLRAEDIKTSGRTALVTGDVAVTAGRALDYFGNAAGRLQSGRVLLERLSGAAGGLLGASGEPARRGHGTRGEPAEPVPAPRRPGEAARAEGAA